MLPTIVSGVGGLVLGEQLVVVEAPLLFSSCGLSGELFSNQVLPGAEVPGAWVVLVAQVPQEVDHQELQVVVS